MPHVKFGTKDEPGFELKESSDLIAVRTRSRRSIRGTGPVPPPTSAEVADGDLVAVFPDAGVEVYRVPPTDRSLPGTSSRSSRASIFRASAGCGSRTSSW